MRSTRMFAAALGALGLLTAGCIDIEQTLSLEKDMSGKAGFTMKFDMEPMVVFMTRMQREMQGKTGEPTKEELDAARKEMLASKKSETKGDFEKDKKELQSKLPKGVTLLDGSFKEDGLKMAANFLFGFDNVSKLEQIKFPKKEEEGQPAGPPGTQNPVESPFDGLKVVDEGKTFLVTSPTENPLAQEKEQAADMDLSPEAKAQMESMFKGLRVAFKITAPFEVVEHNAHRKEGNTLIWEYDLKSLEKMKPEQLAQGVRVRYKK
ncbi:MAG: hypothetical protein ABUT39_28545 [Acidobacteriota bacterium]